ncbi:Alcohol dehydrogenase 7 [Spatholobus suberectus]|nr:Alcohol dehydrogenase 7 [Spatholobus suberectus]
MVVSGSRSLAVVTGGGAVWLRQPSTCREEATQERTMMALGFCDVFEMGAVAHGWSASLAMAATWSNNGYSMEVALPGSKMVAAFVAAWAETRTFKFLVLYILREYCVPTLSFFSYHHYQSAVWFCKFAMEDNKRAPAPTTEGQPIRCKAAVARRAGEPLVMEEIIVPPPMSREVRIRIICSSLCHSDITFWKLQELPAIFPRILGHEAIGVVESVGKDITEVTKGDVVIPVILPNCGECIDCESNKSNQCTNLSFTVSPWMPRDGTTRFTDQNGDIIYHFLYISSFSEYTVVDIANVIKVDPQIPPDRACLLGCGISTGVGAAWRTANVEPGSTVAIFGLGSIGLAAAEGARLCGATRIIGVDINPEKFEIGKKFGLTDFVHAGECDNKTVSQVIIELTGGGADYCFECVGVASLVQEAYASCRKGWGKTIVVGVDKPGAKISLNSYEVLLDGKSLMGSLFGGLKPKSDVPILLKRYMDKELQLDEFVTHEVEFKDINTAFDLLIKGECL